jgi:predicted Fe-Mo cluster-binding NifX family protein
VVLTGKICDCSLEYLSDAGITVVANGSGTVKRVLGRLIEGEYKQAQFACV